jgi:hypothetical protein
MYKVQSTKYKEARCEMREARAKSQEPRSETFEVFKTSKVFIWERVLALDQFQEKTVNVQRIALINLIPIATLFKSKI